MDRNFLWQQSTMIPASFPKHQEMENQALKKGLCDTRDYDFLWKNASFVSFFLN